MPNQTVIEYQWATPMALPGELFMPGRFPEMQINLAQMMGENVTENL